MERKLEATGPINSKDNTLCKSAVFWVDLCVLALNDIQTGCSYVKFGVVSFRSENQHVLYVNRTGCPALKNF